MSTQPSCQLHVIFAADSSKAIIFRWGPTKQTRLIAWDRADDTFEPGQWMKGTRVYHERSDISPDGEYLLLFLGTFRPPFQTYTVLSRPPYYTALALWPKGDTWGGGGIFIGPREIALDHAGYQAELANGFELPSGFTVHLADSSAKALLARLAAHARLAANWRRRDYPAESWTKPTSGGVALVATGRQVETYRRCLDYALVSATREVALPGAQWADLDGNGDVVFAIGGALRRLKREDLDAAMERGDPIAVASVLADFSDMRFEAMVAPYSAGRFFDDPAAFSPRLDRVTKEDRRRKARDRKLAKQTRD